MHFLFIISNPRTLRHLTGTVAAARARNHEVTVFFNEESVKLLSEHDALKGLDANLLACITSCQYSGITQDEFPEGAKMSSLAEAIILIEKADRTLFMG